MRILESIESTFPAPEAWDRLVAQDPRGHLLQTWAWGELKGAFGWSPVRLAVEQDGALVAGAQVLYRKVGPLSMAYIPKGPVFLADDPAVADALWQAVHRRSRRMGAVALKVEPEARDEQQEQHAWFRAHGWGEAQPIQPRRTVHVPLDAEEDAILARMKPKWRYNIRLSARKGVEVREVGEEGMPVFYALMQETGQRDRFAIHSLEYYRRALTLFAPLDRVRLYLAYYEEQPLAGLMAYAFNQQAYYMFGASSNERRELMPNHQLQWRAMQWAKAQGALLYDLWGITDEDPDSPTADLEGVQRFKLGFGGEVVRYVGAYDRVYSRPLYALLNRLWAMRRARAGGN
ncbi:MAG: peptidoglycan bridge formation glycyltransferase FemA/FemB family protein [Chloroflexi bacterium]|jgi:peptidoglycan pentaglycine glycine transferase (the first glycine)|nr:peptidoglycan bridge formation glycyltransferase FemA/FemB family protein [Chloroflexota bacterium]